MKLACLLLALAGCAFVEAQDRPHSLVVPLLHWHFPAGLDKPTQHWFPYSLPDKE